MTSATVTSYDFVQWLNNQNLAALGLGKKIASSGYAHWLKSLIRKTGLNPIDSRGQKTKGRPRRVFDLTIPQCFNYIVGRIKDTGMAQELQQRFEALQNSKGFEPAARKLAKASFTIRDFLYQIKKFEIMVEFADWQAKEYKPRYRDVQFSECGTKFYVHRDYWHEAQQLFESMERRLNSSKKAQELGFAVKIIMFDEGEIIAFDVDNFDFDN